MKSKIIIGALLSFTLSLLIACNPQQKESAGTVIDKEQIKKEIQAKENEWAALYNAKELKDIGYYAEDAISFSQNNAPLIGKEAIGEYLKAGVDSSADGNTISFLTNEVFVSNDANQVVETGYYKLVDSMDIAINTGYYMVLFEKRNGSYVCVRDMSTSDMLR